MHPNPHWHTPSPSLHDQSRRGSSAHTQVNPSRIPTSKSHLISPSLESVHCPITLAHPVPQLPLNLNHPFPSFQPLAIPPFQSQVAVPPFQAAVPPFQAAVPPFQAAVPPFQAAIPPFQAQVDVPPFQPTVPPFQPGPAIPPFQPLVPTFELSLPQAQNHRDDTLVWQPHATAHSVQEPFFPLAPPIPSHHSQQGNLERSHSRAQARIHAFGDKLYGAAYRSHTSSSRGSSRNSNLSASLVSASSPDSSRVRSGRSPLADEADTETDPEKIAAYNSEMQGILRTTRYLSIYSMITEVGWPTGGNIATIWSSTFREAFQEACTIHSNEQEILSGPMERILGKWMTNFRSTMGSIAKKYATDYFMPHDSVRSDPQQFAEWKIQQVLRITQPHDARTYFMHEHDNEGRVVPGRWFGNDILERFHINFWYGHASSPFCHRQHNIRTTPPHMYAYSATALLFALEHEASPKKVIKFEAKEYALCYQDIYNSLVDNLKADSPISVGLGNRLQWLHTRGMERLDEQLSRAGSSRRRPGKAYVPPAEELLKYESQSAGPSHSTTFHAQPQTKYPTLAHSAFPVQPTSGLSESIWTRAPNYLDEVEHFSESLFD